MTQRGTASAVVLLIGLASIFLLSACSGGGGGGGAGTLLLITADGAAQPLWQNVGGVPTVPGVCPNGVFLNATLTFTFNGPVDPASLPAPGPATGSINITSTSTGLPAQGTFTVEDDPALPAGNNRRVVFRPSLLNGASTLCGLGLGQADVFQVGLPAGSGWPQVVVVHGGRIQMPASTCFSTCGCPDPGVCVTSFQDTLLGPPYVIDTIPPTGDPAIGGVDACAVANQTIVIHVSEPLNPNGINLSSVRLVNVATGAQVPGAIVFHQAPNTGGAAGLISQIDYVASSPLSPNATYQILFGPSVTDFLGNPIQTSQSNPSAQLLFATAAIVPTAQPPLVETFDTTANLGDLTGPIRWAGDGVLQVEFPTELTGNGSDGPFNPPAGMTTLLDTNQLVSGVSRKGIWNFTTVTIPQNATVRIIGPYLAHFRCTGAFTLNGTLQAIPGQVSPPVAATPAYDRGAEAGQQNNNNGINCQADGGVGNAGAGAGGAGSGPTPPPGSPPTFQCNLRALMGENGYGPTIDGALNNGSIGTLTYAGGHGGVSGCFPSIPSCTPVLTDLGGLGGAGGTAGRQGEAGTPRLGTCLPNPNVTQPIAQPSPVAAAMIPPIAIQSAGSGGGGGGDHLDSAGTPPNNDDQGGGGGGGGGGLRISCVGAYAQGATGAINASGATGGNAPANLFAAAGGSGSAGEVWIQSFSTITMNATSLISVIGPTRLFPSAGLIGCTNQASGGGGAGLVQMEAGQGPTPTVNFNLQPVPTPTSGAVFSNPPFQFGGTIQAQARSDFRYTGLSVPDYTGAVEVFNVGNAAGATLQIHYEGAFEDVGSTQLNRIPDPATIKSMATGGGPITAANLDELDGYPFIRFVVIASYPAPPATPVTATLPSVDSITINFSGATCP
jgi:hypothetical protein